ncbi:sugar-transfer associated ATP-grasp domain-containing protein [Leucobacter sp. CX328]|uniref:sugar-transfer associated ATP-grasp domain-containing protein n=1 Tax=unclassified Leucobacter TaxID=2621730 RepID=UPI001BFE8950
MTRTMGLGARRRLNYFFDRVKAVDLPRLWGLAGSMSKDARKPRLFILCDMMYSSARYEVAFQDYQDWDFFMLTRAERSTFMTHPKSNHLAQKLNQPEHRARFADKSNFNREFNDYIGREWLDLRESTPEQLEEFVTRQGAVMAKVPDSLGGQGIGRLEASDITDYPKLHAELLAGRQFLVEQVIPQHPEMSRLYDRSVNTLRVVTYFDGTDVHVLASVLKVGNGGAVDNFSHGGMYTMLDDNGKAHYAAFDGENRTFEIHPISGVSIVGFQVPDFDKVLKLVDHLARIVPEIPYVGWDIAISPDRPVVIEGNYNTGVFQSKPSVSGVRTGLLPRYREAIGF